MHDGDTIRIAKQSIRLWGIDAVELKQRCGDIACGQIARDALIALIGGQDVTCIPKGKSYKRVVATCTVNGKDIAAEMTRAGMAFDAAKYSRGFYKKQETYARTANMGLWAVAVENPGHWRACNLHIRGKNKPKDCILE